MRNELVTYTDPKSSTSEMFRTLRTNIQFMSNSKKLQTILITSTLPGEGKSWVSANLAVTFAQAGKKVVLVDADMRKGRQFAIFNVVARPGLSNYLSGVVNDGEVRNVDDVLNFVRQTGVENLYLIPAGDVPPNPSELLINDKMNDLISNLKESFDYIIFDAPPALLVTDAVILSKVLDTTMIVVAHQETKMDNLNKVQKSIKNVGGNIAGVVINKIPYSVKKYQDSYYGGYYGDVKDLQASKKSKASLYLRGKATILDDRDKESLKTKNTDNFNKNTNSATENSEVNITSSAKNEPVKAEPINTESINTESLNTEPAKVQPIKVEPVNVGTSVFNQVKEESVDVEPKKIENVAQDSNQTENQYTYPNTVQQKNVEATTNNTFKSVNDVVEPQKSVYQNIQLNTETTNSIYQHIPQNGQNFTSNFANDLEEKVQNPANNVIFNNTNYNKENSNEIKNQEASSVSPMSQAEELLKRMNEQLEEEKRKLNNQY